MTESALNQRGLPNALLRAYCEDVVRFAGMALGIRMPQAQKDWTRHFTEKRFFHAAPRDHGKSTLYSYILPLWEMARNPEMRILLVSKTQHLASRFITSIREEIESNETLRAIYGDLKGGKPRAWNRNALFLKRKRNIREPTIQAMSALGSCTGIRADLIIADDIIDSEICFFRSQRERVKRWFLSELTPTLEAGGRMLVVGTRKHFDDLYANLIKNPAYNHRIDRAILDEARQLVLMPERWTYERLVEDRREIGSVHFNREKQNEVLDDQTALFRREWLEGCLDANRKLGEAPSLGTAVVQGIDLAAVSDPHRALENDSDYSAVATLALEKDGCLRVADLWMDRGLTPHALLENLIRIGNKWRPRRVIIESNAFQHWVEQELREKSDLPVFGHTTGRGNKGSMMDGVPSLAALFEQRKVILPAGDERSREMSGLLIDQLHRLGWERHDDLAMAFWFAVIGARQVMSAPVRPVIAGALMQRF